MLNWNGSILPRERKNAVRNWARKHAEQSTNPERFIRCFEETLQLLLAEGEQAVTDRPSTRDDVVRAAAEAEALAAHHALLNWGTMNGICYVVSRKGDQALTA